MAENSKFYDDIKEGFAKDSESYYIESYIDSLVTVLLCNFLTRFIDQKRQLFDD